MPRILFLAASPSDALRRPRLRTAADRHRGTGEETRAVYKLHGQSDHFRSVVYENTAHEYLPEMRDRMATWFQKHLAGRSR